MDIQRTLLIGAAILLSFMLLTEWVSFRESKNAPVNSESRFTDAAPAETGAAGADTPDPASITSAQGRGSNVSPDSSADVPSLPASNRGATGGTDAAESPDGSNSASDDVVRIYSDSLQFAVDLDGGDIVEVALPRFRAEIDDPDTPFVLLESGTGRTYVAQSGLIGPNGIDSAGRARFSAEADRFELGDADQLQVDLVWTGSNTDDNTGSVEVIKRFTVERGSYVITVEYLIRNQGSERWRANLFGQIKRDSTPAPQSGNGGMGMQPFLGAATTLPDDRFRKFDFDDIREDPFKAQLEGGWIAMIQHYFLSAWIPGPQQTHSYSTRANNAGFNFAGFVSPTVAVDPGSEAKVSARFYAGPKDQYSLEEISPYLELSVDYGWLWWIAQPLFWLLTKIHSLVSNWGVAIILLTVLIKAVFFQLSATSYKSMARMRQVQPRMQAIREEHAEDKQKQSQAMMDLYKKEKINPMGGCLPILVQMPVFIALYWVLMESVELRHAPFALWINDLSVMDPYFVLPLLMGGSMWFMQKLNPPPPDPMQAKIMQWLPVIFTFFFLWFPAGLVLYWVVNNLLSMAQQWVITKQIEKAAAR